MPVESDSGSSDEEKEQQSTKVNELEASHHYFQDIEMCEFCYGEMVTGQPHSCFFHRPKPSKSIKSATVINDKEVVQALDNEEEVYQASKEDEEIKSHKPESNKIKIKVDGQGVYLKENEWDAYTEGKKTATGRIIPNYKKLDQECKASPTEYFNFMCQEEHSTFHENGNIATFSKIQKVEERAGGKRTRSKAVQEGLAPSMDAFKKTLE